MDTCQLSSLHSCNTIGFPFVTHLGKTLKATDGLSKQEVWELMIGGFWQAFRASIEGQLWEKAARHELGTGLEGGADLTTLFKHDKFLGKKGLTCSPRHALAAATASCWTQERRYRAGLVESPLCPRCEEEDEDMHHSSLAMPCQYAVGIFDETQQLVHKATQAKNTLECFWLKGVCATILDFARHEVEGSWRQFREWSINRSLLIHLWGRLWNAQRPANQACSYHSGVCQTVLGKPWNAGNCTVRSLMNSFKPTGGWMGTLGEGELDTVGRAEFMACVVAAEGTRGSVVHVTDYEILKKGQDRGWPTPRLGQGCFPDIWWRLSPALKSRQGTFTVQWQRAHVAAADIKRENHDMVLVFGNEMADAVAKQAASEAALRGAAAEQISRVDALACQVQRRIIEAASKNHANCFDQSRKGSQEGSVQNRLAVSSRTINTSIGISAIKAEVGMANLQAEHGRNVVSTLAKGRPMHSRNPDHADCWEFS